MSKHHAITHVIASYNESFVSISRKRSYIIIALARIHFYNCIYGENNRVRIIAWRKNVPRLCSTQRINPIEIRGDLTTSDAWHLLNTREDYRGTLPNARRTINLNGAKVHFSRATVVENAIKVISLYSCGIDNTGTTTRVLRNRPKHLLRCHAQNACYDAGGNKRYARVYTIDNNNSVRDLWTMSLGGLTNARITSR